MAINSYIGKVKIGSNESHIGSTLFGLCTTAAGTAAKTVIAADNTGTALEYFDNLITGVTIHVQFENGNTASAPTLKVGTMTVGKPIINPNGTLQFAVNSMISMTYDGDNWVVNASQATPGTVEQTYNSTNSNAISGAGVANAFTTLTDTLTGTPGAGKTITAFDQVDGKVSATFGNISITKSQVSDLGVVSKTADGLVPQLPNETTTTKYLRQDGSWEVPPHHQAKLISGGSASAKSNAARTADQNSIFLNVIENSAVRSSHQIVGSGTTKVSSDANGNITISSADTNEGTVTSITPGAGLVNGATTSTSQAAITASGTISIKEGGVTNDMLAGSITNAKLANSSMSIAGSTVSLGGTLTKDTLISALGIGTAVHYIGNSSTAVTNGGTQKPTIGGSEVSTLAAGDVVLYGNQEYIWTTADKWELFGDQGSYALKTAAVTDVAWDGTNNKLTKTINNATSDVVTISTIKTALALGKGDVGLGSVTNHAQVTSLQWDKTNKKITYKVSEGTAQNVVTFVAGSNINLTAADNQLTIANTYSYTLSAATDDNLGGIRTGYTQSGKTYPVVLDSNNKAYVSVPWTDTNTKVTQVLDSESTDTFPLLFSDNTTATATASITSSAKRLNTIHIQPSTGTLTATKFSGNGSGLTNLAAAAVKTALGVNNSITTKTFLHQDGTWKTISVKVEANNSGSVVTGVGFNQGTFPTLTTNSGKAATFTVANGILTIVAGSDAALTGGTLPSLGTISKANLSIDMS